MTPQRAARARLTTFRVVVLGLVGLFFLVPLVSMLDFSTRNFLGEGRTGAAWTALVTDPDMTGAIVTSLVLAVLGVVRLVTDGDGTMRKAFGVKKTLGILDGRVTFVIDPDGIVRKVFSSQLRAKSHQAEALATITAA